MASVPFSLFRLQANLTSGDPLPWPTDEAELWAVCQDPVASARLVRAIEARPLGPTLVEQGTAMALIALGEAMVLALVTQPLPQRDDEWDAQGNSGPGVEQAQAERAAELLRRAPLLDQVVAVLPMAKPLDTPSDTLSLAYRALESALNQGTFDMAYPVLAPHLWPTDQTVEHSLLATKIHHTLVGNGRANDIQIDLRAVAPAEVLGNLWLKSVIGNAFSYVSYYQLAPYEGWPLPLAEWHASLSQVAPLIDDKTTAKAFETQAAFEAELTKLIETDKVDAQIEAVLLRASANIPGIAPTTRQSWAVDPHTGQSGWQTWLMAQPQAQTLAAPVHAKTALQQAQQDPSSLLQALAGFGSGPYAPHALAFCEEIIQRLAVPEMPSFVNKRGSVPRDLEHAHDRPWRHALLDEVLARVHLPHLPGVAERVLKKVMSTSKGRDAAHLFPRMWPGIDLAEQAIWNKSLFQRLLPVSSYEKPVDLGDFDLAAHTPAHIVGFALVRELSRGMPLSPHFGDLSRFPLPVAEFVAEASASSKSRDGWPDRLCAGLEKALDNPIYPAGLRHRLYEACRPLRPRIAEARFRAEERQLALQNRPVSGARPRRRS